MYVIFLTFSFVAVGFPRIGAGRFVNVVILRNDNASGILHLSSSAVVVREDTREAFLNVVRSGGAFGQVLWNISNPNMRTRRTVSLEGLVKAVFHCSRLARAGGATDFNLVKNQSRGQAKKVKCYSIVQIKIASVFARTKADRKRSD